MGNLGIERLVIRRGNNQHTTIKIAFAVATQDHLTAALDDQLAQLGLDFWRNHAQHCASVGNQA